LRPHVSIEELGPRLAGVLIVLGDWAEAEKLIGLLPVEDSSVRLLRSELAFVRGNFDGALAEAEMALIDNSAERVKVLVRLANLATVAETMQEWAVAEHHHREALRLRREIADARGVLQSLHALGRTRLGAGDRDDAERYFAEAEQLAESLGETLERAKIWHT